MNAAFCSVETTSIAAIQGTGFSSPMAGRRVTAMGVVTQSHPGQGFYFEQLTADLDPASSDGLYVNSPYLSQQVVPGDQIIVGGMAAELGETEYTLTALDQVDRYRICDREQPLPVQETGLPLSALEREAIEGMRVHIQQDLILTDVRNLVTRGEMGVALMNRLMTPTEVAAPGQASMAVRTRNQRNRVALAYPQTALYPAENPAQVQAARVGDQVFDLSGVMTQINGHYQIVLDDLARFELEQDDPKPRRSEGLRVVSVNLENLFNGDGRGGGFPTERGAETLAEYRIQRDRLATVLTAMDADILALQELENDGFDETSAGVDLLRSLNLSQGVEDWRLSVPAQPFPGSSPITVGIAYRADRVEAIGSARWLSGPLFTKLSRPPLGQWFRDRQQRSLFFVISVHLKSKGSCPPEGENANRGDGQACWSPARSQAVEALSAWARRQLLSEQQADIIILGDFNSYRQEDPIRRMNALGWTDVSEAHIPEKERYSYVYRGETGTLDYAFVSPSLAPRVKAARYWHINSVSAIWPDLTDVTDPKRVSDHDPLMVDLDFSASGQDPAKASADR